MNHQELSQKIDNYLKECGNSNDLKYQMEKSNIERDIKLFHREKESEYNHCLLHAYKVPLHLYVIIETNKCISDFKKNFDLVENYYKKLENKHEKN